MKVIALLQTTLKSDHHKREALCRLYHRYPNFVHNFEAFPCLVGKMRSHPAKHVPGRVPELEKKNLGEVYQDWRGVL